MREKRGALVALALLVAVLVCGSLGYRLLSARVEPGPASTEEAESVGASAYPLLADHDPTVFTAEGEAVTLTQIADGRPLVVNFWATWCPYCVEELPDFQGIAADYGDRVSFAFVDVTDGSRETVEGAASFLEENGFADLPAYYDTELAAATEYGASSLPTTVVVDGEGQIVSVSAGMIDPILLRGTLEQMV